MSFLRTGSARLGGTSYRKVFVEFNHDEVRILRPPKPEVNSGQFPKLVCADVYRAVGRLEFFGACFWFFPKTSHMERESVMKANLVKLMSVGLMLGTAAFGSGYKCTSGDTAQGEWSVKMFNHTVTETRVPAVIVVSNEAQGTVLKRTEAEITKRNRANTVQFVMEGNRRIDADSVILQVLHKEGRETLFDAEEVAGQLILVKDGSKEVISLDCARYLKN